MLWLCYFYGLEFSFGALGCGGSYGLYPKSRAGRAIASPSETYPVEKLQWHFTCGFILDMVGL